MIDGYNEDHPIKYYLVTGAGGAVGSYIVGKLIQREDADYETRVIVVDLPGKMASSWKEHPRIQVIEANLTNAKELETLASEVPRIDAVVNTAAIVDIAQPWSVIEPVNVGIATALYDLATSYGAEHFVHISSASIYASPEAGYDKYPLREDDALEGESPYEWSKIQSESSLQYLRLRDKRETPYLTILRPALIYGPKCRFLGASLAVIPSMIGRISSRTVGFTGGPRTNWVHCEDVARAAIHCIDLQEESDMQTYNVCPSETPGFGDVITMHLKAYGLEVPFTVPLPSPSTIRLFKPILKNDKLFDALNAVLENAWIILRPEKYQRGQILVKVDKEAVPYAFKHTIFDNSALLDTGFRFVWDKLELGVQDAMRWYQLHKWL